MYLTYGYIYHFISRAKRIVQPKRIEVKEIGTDGGQNGDEKGKKEKDTVGDSYSFYHFVLASDVKPWSRPWLWSGHKSNRLKPLALRLEALALSAELLAWVVVLHAEVLALTLQALITSLVLASKCESCSIYCYLVCPCACV